MNPLPEVTILLGDSPRILIDDVDFTNCVHSLRLEAEAPGRVAGLFLGIQARKVVVGTPAEVIAEYVDPNYGIQEWVSTLDPEALEKAMVGRTLGESLGESVISILRELAHDGHS